MGACRSGGRGPVGGEAGLGKDGAQAVEVLFGSDTAAVGVEQGGHWHGEGLGCALDVAGVDALDGDVAAVAVGGVHGDVDVVDEAVGAGLPAGDLLTAMEGDAYALVGVCAVGGEQRAERIGIGAVPGAGPAGDDLGRCRPAD